MLSNQSMYLNGLNVSGYNAAIVSNGSINGYGLNISSTSSNTSPNLVIFAKNDSYLESANVIFKFRIKYMTIVYMLHLIIEHKQWLINFEQFKA